MRAYLMLYSTDIEVGDDDRELTYKSGKSRASTCRAYTFLSSVSFSWWKTLSGWPQSPTSHCLRHHLKKLIARECKILELIIRNRLVI